MNYTDEKAFLQELASLSGRVLRNAFSEPTRGLEIKADASPVTQADQEAERVLRDAINQRYPGHGIFGEEFGIENGNAEYVWVLDPIDGTKSFITGVPLFGTLIGLLHKGQPVLGAIHQPILNELMIGDNTTTTLNGRPVKARPCSSIGEATLLTTDPLNPAKYQNGAAFDSLAQSARLYRTFGDCYGYLLVASGRADAMVDPILSPWDYLPLVPVMRGAGAAITDWQGRSAARLDAKSCIAAGPELHQQIIRRLNPTDAGGRATSPN